MNEITNLVIGQSGSVYAAGAYVLGAVLVFNLFISSRKTKRTILGRLLGYAPPIANRSVPQLDVSELIAKHHIDHQQAIAQQSAQFDQRLAELFDQITALKNSLNQIAQDRSVTTAIDMARQGANVDDIAKLSGLSAEEAEVICKFANS